MNPIKRLTLPLVLVAAWAAEAHDTGSSPPRIDFTSAARAAAPAVVNIFATRLVETRSNPFSNDPFFRDFFMDFGFAETRIQNSLGSGVIMGEDGIVVSNFHVVGNASEIRVVLNDKREYDAELILGDEDVDLAVLKLKDASGLQIIEPRPLEMVEVGEPVLAIGNPFGIGQTVSNGIVSGFMPSVTRGFYIQTDAPIYTGNSGGALVDADGRLIGINTALRIEKGAPSGIGFAIPADLVAEFVEQAREGLEEFKIPWTGISVQTVDHSMAEAMGMEMPKGVLISNLHPQSPFAASGLEQGDVLTTFNRHAVNDHASLHFRVASTGIGESATVEFLRDGKSIIKKIDMASPPEYPPRKAGKVGGNGPLSELIVSNVNPAVIVELGLGMNADGVVIAEAPRMLQRVGLNRGDIVRVINGAEIGSVEEFKNAANIFSRVWLVEIDRNGQSYMVKFRI